MEATAHRQPLRLAARALLLTIAIAAIAVAAYGLWLVPGAMGLGAGSKDAATVTLPPQPVLAIGKPARTTFGHMRVLDAHAVTGLTNQQLGNMTHGISGLIDARNAQMQVAIELTNSTNLANHWTAADFRLETVSGEHMYAALGGTQESGTLAPGSSVDLGLNFVVPRDGSKLVLRVRDGEQYVRVHVGRVAKAPPGTKGIQHNH